MSLLADKRCHSHLKNVITLCQIGQSVINDSPLLLNLLTPKVSVANDKIHYVAFITFKIIKIQ